MTAQDLINLYTLSGNQQAANIVAYVDQRLSEHTAIDAVDIAELSGKIAQINAIIDGDPNTDGAQAWLQILAKVDTLTTSSTASAADLAALQSQVTNYIAAINIRLDSLENRVTAIENTFINQSAFETGVVNFVTRDELSNDLSAALDAFKQTLWAGRTPPVGL